MATGVTVLSKDEFRGDKTETIPAAAILVSTGAAIDTGIVPPTLLNPDGSVRVNAHLRTSDTNIYAAGDIASFPSLITETS
jgi:thioredoxin reductase